MNFNPNESLDNKLEQNKQKEFAEERKVLTKKEVSELETPFWSFDPDTQKAKEAEIAAKIKAEEAKENNDDLGLDFDINSNIFNENSIVPQETIDDKIEETQDEDFTLKETEETYYPGLSDWSNPDTSAHYSEEIEVGETSDSDIEQSDIEFIWEQITKEVTTDVLLSTATGWLSSAINTVNTIDTIQEIKEHKEEQKDDIEITKNKESFKEFYSEEAKKLYSDKIVIPNKENNLWDKYKFPDLLEHVASNYKVNENKNWEINKNKDLNSAFKETVKELLEWKHNQNQDKIDNYITQLSREESLLDKFLIFKKIKNLIETSEWSHWARQAKAFEQATKSEVTKIKTTKEFANKLIEYIQKNTQEAQFATERLKEITDNLFKEDKEISQNEIIDKIKEVSEIIWVSVKES